MKLTARLALSQLKVNKRRTTWTLVGIILSTAIITGVYSLGFASGLDLVDRLIGESDFRYIYERTIAGLAALMSLFIISISIVVVSNTFRVSASERSAQFGILKSVGATKRQITETVIYEAVFLTLIGIPIGMIIGLLLQWVGVSVINHFMDAIIQQENYDFYGMYENQLIRFVWSGFALFLSLAVSFLTVMVSAWLPANKAAKTPAIHAIHGVGEINVKNKKVFAVGLIGKVFKIEGLLASKFLKRSKRNFRATVISLSFSVILFVAAGGFFAQVTRMTEMFWGGVDATVRLNIWSSEILEEVEPGVWEVSEETRDMTADELNEITMRFQDFLGEEETIFGIGRQVSNTVVPEEMISARRWEVMEYRWQDWPAEEIPQGDERFSQQVILTMVDLERYAQLVEVAGVEMGSNLLINYDGFQFTDGRRMEYEPFHFTAGQMLELFEWEWNESLQEFVPVPSEEAITLHAELTREDVPVELMTTWWPEQLMIIVPEVYVRDYEWFVNTENTAAFIAYAEEVLVPLVEEEVIEFSIFDIEEERETGRNMIRLLMVLTFGFVGLLTAIGLTNVISTISENVRTRAKEFAVLQSVGMTSDGIKRMLSMESVFSALKALMFGLPGGVLASLGLHHMMRYSADFAYELPWLPMGVSVFAVFVITWLTMRYAANKLKDRNIIETIRSGNGM